MLRALHIKDVGPGARFDLELGERLNVLTGDNGLGKSFVLEVAWWALTGAWTGRPVLPHRGKDESAEIGGEVAYTLKWEHGEHVQREGAYAFEARFNRVAQQWAGRLPHRLHNTSIQAPTVRVEIPAWLELAVPVLYVRTNGAFALWDPARGTTHDGRWSPVITIVEAYDFNERDLWGGLEHDGRTICNGLIQDWVTWQLEAEAGAGEDHPFHLLRSVLEALSHPDERMTPGKPVRLYVDDIRKFPTIDLPYESGVPIVHASAGMKRILGLSYLLTWAWTEHVQASRMIGWNPATRLVVLLEEPETHLHPKWQRHIVPALLRVLSGLAPDMHPQVLLTTHAPLVLASLEPHFNVTTDKLFSFELKDGREAAVEELCWANHGDAVGWLTSEVFDLAQARSPEAERAIAAAYDFMAGRHDSLPEHLRTADAIHAELERVLAQQDPFWPQWLFARRREEG